MWVGATFREVNLGLAVEPSRRKEQATRARLFLNNESVRPLQAMHTARMFACGLPILTALERSVAPVCLPADGTHIQLV